MDPHKTQNDDTLYGAATPRNFDEGLTPSISLDDKKFKEYENLVFSSRPDIKTFIEENGEKTFFEYSKSHIRENRNPTIKERKKELHGEVYAEIAPLLGSKIAKSVIKQMKDNYSVSTIQHSVPLGHPYILSAVFNNATPYMGGTFPYLQNVIVLANSLASFNNYSFPKADILHLLENVKLESRQFSFFGQTREASPTIFQEPFGEEEISEIKKRIMQIRQEGKIGKEELSNLLSIIEEVYSSPHVLSQKSYLDQLTVLNFYLFKIFMKGYSKNVPNLVFLSQELLTLRLLLTYHMHEETILGKLLFDPKFHKIFLKEFDGLNGAFSIERDKGTFLFWAYPKGARYRERMMLVDGVLKSTDSEYELILSPENVRIAIQNNEIIPSTSLVFITLAFYYGLFLGGGIAQVKNLKSLKRAYEALLEEADQKEEISVVSNLNVSNLIISRATFLYMKKNRLRIPLTGMDIIAYGHKMDWDEVFKSTKNVKMKNIMARIYPFYYSQFLSKKDEELESVTEKDIEDFIGLDKSLPALFSVSSDS